MFHGERATQFFVAVVARATRLLAARSARLAIAARPICPRAIAAQAGRLLGARAARPGLAARLG